MCPPALPFPLGENHLFCNDEQIIWFLSEYTPGSDLPDQVLADSSPYQYPPSNLPGEFWAYDCFKFIKLMKILFHALMLSVVIFLYLTVQEFKVILNSQVIAMSYLTFFYRTS